MHNLKLISVQGTTKFTHFKQMGSPTEIDISSARI